MEGLLKALDNENNTGIIHLTKANIKSVKNDYLQKLQLSKEGLKEYHKKLKDYRYVDELVDIKYGSYIRWISLNKPEYKLTNGGFIVDIKILENGIHLVTKNNMNRLIQIKLDDNFIFQKLSDQEKAILAALEYINK